MTRQHDLHFAAYYRWLVITRILDIHLQADSVLDVGCGNGYFLSQQVGRIKVGVDLHPSVEPRSTWTAVQADGCALPFVSRSFVCVVAFDIIEHIEDDQAFITSLTRVLKLGGHLWLSTPTNTSYLFPAFLTRRLIHRWGHQRVGYNVEDLVTRFPPHCQVQVTLWNARMFRYLYITLWALSRLSPSMARLGARICFEIDRRLPGGRDHIFLEVTRNERLANQEERT